VIKCRWQIVYISRFAIRLRITNFDIFCPAPYPGGRQTTATSVIVMNISLTPELGQLVHDKVRTGLYQTASEVVREGLRLLMERDQHLEALRRDIRAGFQAVDQGEYTDYNAANIEQLAQRVKRRGRQSLAAESANSAKR